MLRGLSATARRSVLAGQRRYVHHNTLGPMRSRSVRGSAQRPKRQERRQMSFFDDLKKAFQEELDKNKEFKEASEQVQQQLSKATKSADKEAGKTADAAKAAAAKSAEAAREAAAKSQEKLKSAAEETTKHAESAKKKLEELSQSASKHTDKLKDFASSKAGILDGLKDKVREKSSTIKQRVSAALKEEVDAIKSTEEFKNIQKEVGQTTSTVSETLSKAKSKVAASKEGDSLVGIALKSAQASLGETSWRDEFKALFKPEKKVKTIKLAGAVSEELKDQKKAAQEAAEEAAENYDGPTGLMKVDQPKTGWDAFSERLSSTPLISRLLKESREANKKFTETGTGQAVKGAVDATKDMRDELRERWETSQNPWVYRLSGWHDTFFAETETSQAVREVQRLDPDFEIEEFLQALQAETLPSVIQNFVEGNNDALRSVLSEGAYAMTYAAMKARVAEGHIMDPNVLHLEEPTLLLAQVMDKMPPVFLVRSVAHQVNCIRNRDGEITEGSPSEIRTIIYMMAFQQEVDEDIGEVAWKIVEFGVHPLEARFI